MARLKIKGPEGVSDVLLGERLTVGRTEGVDLVLDDKGISRKHCEFARTASGYVVRDLGSSNGTLVNGQKVTEHALADGDEVRAGGVSMRFTTSDADCALRFTSGEHAGREIALTAARTTLGRRPDNVIPFVDVKVSGVHLEIVKEGEGFVLRDLGSTNGTFLDGKKVTEVALSHGDRVKLGDNELAFVDLRKGEPEAAAAAGPERVAVTLPPKRSSVAAVLSLVGVTLVVGAAAAWYFLFAQGDSAPTSGRVAAAPPDGTLLSEDWSFEDASATASLWTAELGDGFSARRGNAASGSFAFVASPAEGHTVAAKRAAKEISSARTLRCSGQIAAEPGTLASVSLRFLRAADDATEPRSLTIVAGRAHDGAAGSFSAFQTEVTPPAWAKRVEVVAVARGEGSVAIDDLALVVGGPPPAAGKLGELALRPRGGGAFVVDHGAPLLELFAPLGVGTVAPIDEGAAPARVELPPGAFVAEVAGVGASLALRPGSGPFGAQGFAAACSAELAAAGATLFTGAGAEQRFGAFDVESVSKVLLGSAAERFELAFAPPARLAAHTRGDALELRVFTPGDVKVTWRTGFDAERKEASELLARAAEAWRNGQAGAALAKLREVNDRLPYDEKTVASARALATEIVPKLQAELEAIEAEARAAEFLGSLERSRRTLARAQALLAQAEGLDAAKELGKRVDAMQQQVAAMEREQREQEAARLLKLARAYEAQKPPAPDRSGTATELLAELQRSYADTAAAREARGERDQEGSR